MHPDHTPWATQFLPPHPTTYPFSLPPSSLAIVLSLYLSLTFTKDEALELRMLPTQPPQQACTSHRASPLPRMSTNRWNIEWVSTIKENGAKEDDAWQPYFLAISHPFDLHFDKISITLESLFQARRFDTKISRFCYCLILH